MLLLTLKYRPYLNDPNMVETDSSFQVLLFPLGGEVTLITYMYIDKVYWDT